MPVEIMGVTLYSIKELSGILDVTVVTLRKYFRSGKMKAQKIGGKWYVTEENVKKFLGGDSA